MNSNKFSSQNTHLLCNTTHKVPPFPRILIPRNENEFFCFFFFRSHHPVGYKMWNTCERETVFLTKKKTNTDNAVHPPEKTRFSSRKTHITIFPLVDHSFHYCYYLYSMCLSYSLLLFFLFIIIIIIFFCLLPNILSKNKNK